MRGYGFRWLLNHWAVVSYPAERRQQKNGVICFVFESGLVRISK
jgi:hypothetical protein